MRLIVTETILYLTFLGMDIFGLGNTTPIKFASILLLTLSVLDFHERKLSVAFLFTAFADFFLLVLDRYYAAGVLSFLVVQVCYALRLAEANTSGDPKSTPSRLWLRFAFPAAAGIAAYLFGASYGLGLVESLAVCYILLFTENLAASVRLASETKQRKWILFAIGLALFFCCDICVGIHNVPAVGGPAFRRFADIAMWGFYLPGQVLIRTSGYCSQPESTAEPAPKGDIL